MGSREDIVAAAASVMREQGYARATTKEIARAAGYSEALLYKHFKDKTEIFLCVLTEENPPLAATVHELIETAGEQPIEVGITRIVRGALDFFLGSFPIGVSVFSTKELLTAHRERLAEVGAGPRNPIDGVALYLRKEIELGRVNPETDPEAAASLLLGACFHHAFLCTYEAVEPEKSTLDELATALAKTALSGLQSPL